jgi:hypothetical protein
MDLKPYNQDPQRFLAELRAFTAQIEAERAAKLPRLVSVCACVSATNKPRANLTLINGGKAS